MGIDRIIERAGVAKASLYNLFGSKEELVAAYLASRHDRTTDRLTRAMDQVDGPRQKILAVFDSQAQQYQQPGFNGCAFIAATTEAPSEGSSSKRPTGSGPGCAPCSPTWPSRPEPPTPGPSGANSISSTTGPGCRAAWTTTTPGWPRPCAVRPSALVDAALARR